MRKLDLTDYTVEVVTGEGVGNAPFPFKSNLIEVIFNPKLEIGAYDLLKRNEIAQAIMACGDSILLEESDYSIIKDAVERMKGYQRYAVELVRRVLEAPVVEIKEA